MSFLHDDEFFLLMDIATTNDFDPLKYPLMPNTVLPHISLDEMKMLRDAGVQTALPFRCVRKELETAPGVYNWRYFDDYVNQAFKAGMKTILFTTTHGYPDWLPDEFFVHCDDGVHREALSPWSQEALEDNNEFSQRLVDRYSSKHCLIASSQLSVGETVLLNKPAFYDAAAVKSFQEFTESEDLPTPGEARTENWLLESYIKMLVSQQSLLAKQCNEIFIMLHPAIKDMGFYGNGCQWIDEILFALTHQIPGVLVNHIYYTWIQWPMYWPLMNSYRDKYGEHVFGGAEYAEGLPTTTPAAISQGLRGQIIAPCYPGIHDHIEPWMIENIRTAQRLWMESI